MNNKENEDQLVTIKYETAHLCTAFSDGEKGGHYLARYKLCPLYSKHRNKSLIQITTNSIEIADFFLKYNSAPISIISLNIHQ